MKDESTIDWRVSDKQHPCKLPIPVSVSFLIFVLESCTVKQSIKRRNEENSHVGLCGPVNGKMRRMRRL